MFGLGVFRWGPRKCAWLIFATGGPLRPHHTTQLDVTEKEARLAKRASRVSSEIELLALGTRSGEVLVWNAEDGTLMHKLDEVGVVARDLACAAFRTVIHSHIRIEILV